MITEASPSATTRAASVGVAAGDDSPVGWFIGGALAALAVLVLTVAGVRRRARAR